jgi:hypothetical protein
MIGHHYRTFNDFNAVLNLVPNFGSPSIKEKPRRSGAFLLGPFGRRNRRPHTATASVESCRRRGHGLVSPTDPERPILQGSGCKPQLFDRNRDFHTKSKGSPRR